MLNNEEMRLRYFELTGIKLSVDDPIFAIGNLTEIVLGQLIEATQERLAALPADLNAMLSTCTIEQRSLIDSAINSAVENIKNQLAEVEQRASRLAEESLTHRIDAHAAQIVEHLKTKMAPLLEIAKPIEKMRKDAELMAELAKMNKPSIWPAAWTGAVCAVFAFTATLLGTIWISKDYVESNHRIAVKQYAGIDAMLKVLPKRDRAKAEAAYKQAFDAAN